MLADGSPSWRVLRDFVGADVISGISGLWLAAVDSKNGIPRKADTTKSSALVT